MYTRFLSIDILKGIGILFVLTAHFFGGFYSGFVYSFHMPLFFIVAGLFMKPMDLKSSFKKNFTRLLYPVFLTCFVILMICILFRMLGLSIGYDPSDLFWRDNPQKYNYFVIPGNMWFLFALFWSKEFFNFYLNYVHSRTFGFVSLVILGLCAFLIGQYVILPFCILQGFTMLPLLLVGYWFKQSINIDSKLPSWGYLLIIVWFMSSFDGGIAVNSIVYKYGYLLDLLLACGGTYFFYLVAKVIELKTTYFKNILSFLGKNTIILVCMPGIESCCFPMQDVIPVDLPMKVLWVGSAKVLWCVLSFYVCIKVSFLRKIFGVEKF